MELFLPPDLRARAGRRRPRVPREEPLLLHRHRRRRRRGRPHFHLGQHAHQGLWARYKTRF